MLNTVRRVAWTEGDPQKMLETNIGEMRRAHNLTYRDRFEVTTTLTATATVLWQNTIPSSCGWSVDFSVLGFATDGSMAAYRRMVRFRRQGTAAPTAVVADTIGTDYEDVAGWAITIDVTSNDARLRVAGDATRTVTWRATIDVEEVR